MVQAHQKPGWEVAATKSAEQAAMMADKNQVSRPPSLLIEPVQNSPKSGNGD